MTLKLPTIALACLVAAGGCVAFAAGPDSHPAVTTAPTGSDEAAHGGRGGRGGAMHGDPTKDPHWDAALVFLKINSPLRTKAVTEMPDSAPAKQRLEGMLLYSYESTERLKTDTDHDLYDAVVARMQVEDSIFGLVADLRNNPNDAKLKASLHDEVAKFVDANLKERQLRLDQLKKTVDKLQADLATDTANKSKTVETRMDEALKGDLEQFGMRGPRGGNGGHNHQGQPDQPASDAPKP
jgi:hypothetical protein